jgi:hypothetical protein
MPAAAMVARPVKVRRLNLLSLIDPSLDAMAGYGFICSGWLISLSKGYSIKLDSNRRDGVYQI